MSGLQTARIEGNDDWYDWKLAKMTGMFEVMTDDWYND